MLFLAAKGVVLALVTFLLVESVYGTHFRFGSLSWSRDKSKPNKYELVLKVHLAYRKGSLGGNHNVGDEFYANRIDWGDRKWTVPVL